MEAVHLMRTPASAEHVRPTGEGPAAWLRSAGRGCQTVSLGSISVLNVLGDTSVWLDFAPRRDGQTLIVSIRLFIYWVDFFCWGLLHE